MATKKTTTKKAPKPTAAKKTAKLVASAKAKTADSAAKKLSQFQAAIKVLAEAKEPMNCTAMVEAMQNKGYRTYPRWRGCHRLDDGQHPSRNQLPIGRIGLLSQKR